MKQGGHKKCIPVLNDPEVTEVPFSGLTSGYITRALASLPKQGSKAPWRLRESYPLDILSLRYGVVDDGVLTFS